MIFWIIWPTIMLLFWDTSGPIGWQWRIFCALGGFFRNLKMILCFLTGGTRESKSFVLALLESGLFKTKHKEVSNSAGFFVWKILERRGSRWVLVPPEDFTRNHMEPENGTHEDEIPSKTAFLSNGDGCSTVIATWRVGENPREKNAGIRGREYLELLCQALAFGEVARI